MTYLLPINLNLNEDYSKKDNNGFLIELKVFFLEKIINYEVN